MREEQRVHLLGIPLPDVMATALGDCWFIISRLWGRSSLLR